LHVQRYAPTDTADCVDDSVHVALLLHGLLAHSLTSTSQLPLCALFAVLSATVHSDVYKEMKLYPHIPFVKPLRHAHRYALTDTFLSAVESWHLAPFLQGLLTHSFTSMAQLPLLPVLLELSDMAHAAPYAVCKDAFSELLHQPPAKPTTHAHLYAPTAIVVSFVDSVHDAPLTHGLLLHSSTSMLQLPPVLTVHCAAYSPMKL